MIIADTTAVQLGPDIIGLDSDRNGLVSLATIQMGQDAFLVREAGPNETQKITTPDGKGFNRFAGHQALCDRADQRAVQSAA